MIKSSLGHAVKLVTPSGYLTFHHLPAFSGGANNISKLSYKLSLILYYLIACFLQLTAHNTSHIVKTLSRMEKYFYNAFLKRNL